MQVETRSLLLAVVIIFITPCTFANSIDEALAAYSKRDIDTAVSILDDLASEDDKLALMHLAKVHLRSGNARQGLKVTQRLIDNYPDDPDAHHAYGIANLTMMSEVSMFKFVSTARKAKAGWEKAVALDPNHLDGLYALFSYYANAPKIGGGDIEEARNIQAHLSTLDEGYGNLALGVLLSKSEQFAEAEAAFIRTTEVMDTAGSYFALAQFYVQQEQFSKALAAISSFTSKPADFWDPDPVAEHLVIARAQAGLGNVDAARAAIKTGLSMKPGKRIRGFFEETEKSLP